MCAGASAQLGWSSICDMFVQWPPGLSYTLDPFSVTHGFRFFFFSPLVSFFCFLDWQVPEWILILSL